MTATQTVRACYVQYPALSDGDAYIRPAVKIEAGAKSALDPHNPMPVKPYIADDLPNFNLTVPGVTTVDPVRTFWDKVLILHSLRHSFDIHGKLRGGGQRVSRHYYDVHRMLRTEIGHRAIADLAMARDCMRHERMFFRRPSPIRRCQAASRSSPRRHARSATAGLSGDGRHDLRRCSCL